MSNHDHPQAKKLLNLSMQNDLQDTASALLQIEAAERPPELLGCPVLKDSFLPILAKLCPLQTQLLLPVRRTVCKIIFPLVHE